jgi:rsbT co-antagonist protein RsbR
MLNDKAKEMTESSTAIASLIAQHQHSLLADWLECQRRDGATRTSRAEAGDASTRFLDGLRRGAASGNLSDIAAPEWAATRDVLEDLSRHRATEGFTPSQTATFVFSLKEPLFDLLRKQYANDGDALARETWTATRLLDRLGLFTVECFLRTREDVIGRQQQELLELSTPVVSLWSGILALPLIGTLDSARTQIVMESLLEQIVTSNAEFAIIDITGVPTVDTLVAQHLIKTISAARLMGADCIISGIRPQIAQTIVHLGLDLNVVSKATMADAFALALRRMGKAVVDRAAPAPPRD